MYSTILILLILFPTQTLSQGYYDYFYNVYYPPENYYDTYYGEYFGYYDYVPEGVYDYYSYEYGYYDLYYGQYYNPNPIEDNDEGNIDSSS